MRIPKTPRKTGAQNIVDNHHHGQRRVGPRLTEPPRLSGGLFLSSSGLIRLDELHVSRHRDR